MTSSTVATATGQDRDRLIDTMLLAFARDPIMRWAFPDPHRYITHFRSFTAATCVRSFEHNSVHHTPDCSAATFWLPPTVELDAEAAVGVLEKSLEANALTTAFAILEQMGRYHPAEPHWYLWMIGVDPPSQGRGHGNALLRHGLDRIDRDGMAAYLENSNPANTKLYERHGFEVMGTIQVGDAPPIWPMLRRSR